MLFALCLTGSLLASPLLFCPPALAQETPVSAVKLPQTPDHPTCQAAAALLTDLCDANESLAVMPPFGVQNRVGDWDQYTARCTHRETGKHRNLRFYAPPEVKDRQADFIFENKGIRKEQARRLLAAANGYARKVADVVIFAEAGLRGPVLDGGGPTPAPKPAVADEVLSFTLGGDRTVRVALKGDGPIVIE